MSVDADIAGAVDWMEGLEETSGAKREPVPIRNHINKPGPEIVVLRYLKLKKGRFPDFLKATLAYVWPYVEKIGARPIACCKWTKSGFGTDSPDYDEAVLITRYVSNEHWKMTRETFKHSGNGPDWRGFNEAVAFRRSITLDTNATFMEGHYHNYGCFYMPGVEGESYKRIKTVEDSQSLSDDGGDDIDGIVDWMEGPEGNIGSLAGNPEENSIAVRNDVHQVGGREIVVLRYLKLKKGSFNDFFNQTLKYVWPYQEKNGARHIGCYKWTKSGFGTDSPDYDEASLITRYASYKHWKMTRETFKHGGNGPDWQAFTKAIAHRRSLTLQTNATFMEGHINDYAPKYMPALKETYAKL